MLNTKFLNANDTEPLNFIFKDQDRQRRVSRKAESEVLIENLNPDVSGMYLMFLTRLAVLG